MPVGKTIWIVHAGRRKAPVFQHRGFSVPNFGMAGFRAIGQLPAIYHCLTICIHSRPLRLPWQRWKTIWTIPHSSPPFRTSLGAVTELLYHTFRHNCKNFSVNGLIWGKEQHNTQPGHPSNREVSFLWATWQGKFAHNVVHVRARRVGQRGNLRKRGRTVMKTRKETKRKWKLTRANWQHL